MKIYPITRPSHRYIALDLHKEYALAGGMSAVQEWLLPPRRIEISQFGEWARKSLCESDAVVLETCLPFAQPGATALHFSQNLLLRATLQAHPHRLSAQSKLLFVIHAFSLSQKA